MTNQNTVKRRKYLRITLPLWMFFGTLGAHRFYTKKPKTATVQLILGALGWSLIFPQSSSVGIFFLFPLGIWLIADFFWLSHHLDSINMSHRLSNFESLRHIYGTSNETLSKPTKISRKQKKEQAASNRKMQDVLDQESARMLGNYNNAKARVQDAQDEKL